MVLGMTRNPARPLVFDLIERTNPKPKEHLETSFEFLNRVAGTYWAQVRELVQHWLDRVPGDKDYRDLRGRLRTDDAANYSAFLELYLHELFRRAGYEVSIHPVLRNGTRRPDFLVCGHGQSFYVEATMPGPQLAAHSRSQRRSAFLDTIQRCSNKNFLLSLDHLDVGASPARGRRARRAIEMWLSSLDPDSVSYNAGSRETFRWVDGDWEAHFSAIPLLSQHRGRPDHRAIGVYGDSGVGWIDDAPTIKSSLNAKASAYGVLDRPLIIAVGTYIWDRDYWHSTNALYGGSAVTWWENDDGAIEHAEIRQPDGFFGTPPNWANHNVAAVLHINQLQPHHLQNAEVTLWTHPAAPGQWDSLAAVIPCTARRLVGRSLEESRSATDPAEFFDLPTPWPIGSAFPSDDVDADATAT
jgi:hypothetical protein